MEQLGMLSEIVLSFTGDKDFETQLERVLILVGRYFSVSRLQVFLSHNATGEDSALFEWRSPEAACSLVIEAEALFEQLQPVLNQGALSEADVINLFGSEGVFSLPGDKMSLRIQPIRIQQQVQGMIVLENGWRKGGWTDVEKRLLQLLAEMVANACEKKLYQAEILASRDNLQSFFNSVDDLFYICRLNGEILLTNEAVVRKTGYSAEELGQMSLMELHPADKREEALENLQLMLTGEIAYCPLEIEDRAGRRFPVENRIWVGLWDKQPCIFGMSKDLRKEQEALQWFTKVFEHNPLPMAISREQTILRVNAAYLAKLGYVREELIGRTCLEAGLLIDPEKFMQIMEIFKRDRRLKNIEINVRCKSGRIINGLLSGEIIENQGEVFFLTTMVDVTEIAHLTQALTKEKQRLENIIYGTGAGAWEWNMKTGRILFNGCWESLTGYSIEELEYDGISGYRRRMQPEDLVLAEALLRAHCENAGGDYKCEYRFKHKAGHWIWVLASGRVLDWGADGVPLKMYGTVVDITKLKQAEAAVRELSVRDPLTNIYNRRYVFEHLRVILAELRREERVVSVSLLDLDWFKRVNDCYGHLAGDFILKNFSEIIKQNLRPYDVFGRYGGEEFIIVSMNSTKEDSQAMVQRILGRMRTEIFLYDRREIRCTFSAGIVDTAEIPENDFSVEGLLRRADERLYRAKNKGRNTIETDDGGEPLA